MPRFRRYRVFLIFAAILIFSLYRFAQTGSEDGISTTSSHRSGSFKPGDGVEGGYKQEGTEKEQKGQGQRPALVKTNPVVDLEGMAHKGEPVRTAHFVPSASKAAIVKATSSTKIAAPAAIKTKSAAPKVVASSTKVKAAASKTEELFTIQTAPTVPVASAAVLPDRKPAPIDGESGGNATSNTVLMGATKSRPLSDLFTTTPVIHWKKQVEHFPVATESLIRLPTGIPKKMPRIQFDFPAEKANARAKREERRAEVKAEFLHAWSGYKDFAWMHDEVMPVTGGVKDPFCGWAATMVDALDTLWIMGLKEEFEEAVLAIDTIDFTTTHRNQIPVFETTIRYLGGLLAAYDISGAKYDILLKKATELAEILMGVFDTPNRMPVLYYSWKPAFASQPHRASSQANFAELGSLCMEFTRLAQLTGEDKYYDAVARITNELVDWQKRGTKMKGVFPDTVDASGCDKTAPVTEKTGSKPALTDPVGYQPYEESQSNVYASGKAHTITPGKTGVASVEPVGHDASAVAANPLGKRQLSEQAASIDVKPVSEYIGPNRTVKSTTTRSFEEDSWDCVPQGLTSIGHGRDHFSMGGGQDSSYEYFSKMWLLLGGLEDKYRTLYLGTMDAIKNYMLFRPMIPDAQRSILFSAKVGTYGHPEQEDDLEMVYEVTHLTCFLGGMVGMGAKLFNLNDMSIAERLTDGCVWAYEATQTGIMPEDARAVPCESVTNCTWDEGLWHRYLDPQWEHREKNIKAYEEHKAAAEKKEAEERRVKEAEKQKALNGEADEVVPTENDSVSYSLDGSATKSNQQLNPRVAGNAQVDDDTVSVSINSTRSAANSTLVPASAAAAGEPHLSKRGTLRPTAAQEEAFKAKLAATEAELNPDFSNRVPPSKTPAAPAVMPPIHGVPASASSHYNGAGSRLQVQPGELDRDPNRPLTHEEYIKQRLEQDRLPRGFAGIVNGKYILR
jgi:mannosyl-oligosaccharide alpha-1,2-mannosidase